MSEYSILQTGNGLFNTHVTIENVEKVIQNQLKTGSKLGKNTKITLIGERNGIMSRILLVEPDWTETFHDFLPLKFVLKIPYCLHVQGIIEKMRASNPLDKEKEDRLWEMLGMEIQSVHNREILKSLAHLQVESLHFNDDEIEKITGFDMIKMVGPIMNDDGMKAIFQQIRDLNPERFGEKIRKIEDFGKEIVNFELASNLNKYVDIRKNVLVHGDLWSPNVLWKHIDGKFSVENIIDYQAIHMGNPSEDLVRLFVSSLSGTDRQNFWEHLLEKFYQFFLEALGKNSVPYSLDQLKDSYRYYFVFGGLALIPMFCHVFQTNIVNFPDLEMMEKSREIIEEKIEKLLEDVEKFHLLSRNVTKSYKKPVRRS
uniref:CHK domain-containing protein n=2 Tax=Caenorhabditis tropicalis TaxID=1561998 RepID=A0A1I7UYA0_9PELO